LKKGSFIDVVLERLALELGWEIFYFREEVLGWQFWKKFWMATCLFKKEV
jgi:hypothetical protein